MPSQSFRDKVIENAKQARFDGAISNPFKRFRMTDEMVETLLSRNPAIRLDASQVKAITVSQLEKVSQVIHEQKFVDLTSGVAFPLVPDPPSPGHKDYAWRELEGFGKAKPAATYKGNPPRVDFGITKQSTPIAPLVIAYGWDVGQIEQATLFGLSLPTWDGVIARKAIETEINNRCWFGDAKLNIPGMLGQVTNLAASTSGAAWSGATAAQIEADVIELLQSIITYTKGKAELKPNRLALPSAQYAKLATARILNTSDTLLSYLERVLSAAAGGPFVILSANECAGFTVPAIGTRDLMLMYRYDPMVLGRITALPYTELPPQNDMYEIVVPCRAESGGVAVFQPTAVAYRYGI